VVAGAGVAGAGVVAAGALVLGLLVSVFWEKAGVLSNSPAAAMAIINRRNMTLSFMQVRLLKNMPPFKFRRIGIDQISETILASA
jgi:hypothetical protein